MGILKLSTVNRPTPIDVVDKDVELLTGRYHTHYTMYAEDETEFLDVRHVDRVYDEILFNRYYTLTDEYLSNKSNDTEEWAVEAAAVEEFHIAPKPSILGIQGQHPSSPSSSAYYMCETLKGINQFWSEVVISIISAQSQEGHDYAREAYLAVLEDTIYSATDLTEEQQDRLANLCVSDSVDMDTINILYSFLKGELTDIKLIQPDSKEQQRFERLVKARRSVC